MFANVWINLSCFLQIAVTMEKGNEGDEIIFLSLRQIECAIPDTVVKVGQITADLLVEIIARCLVLISDGEIKVRFSYGSAFSLLFMLSYILIYF